MTSPEYQAPTWVNEDDPAFIEGVSPDLGAGYLNELSGAVEDHGQRLGAITPVVANLQNTALDQATGDNRYILQTVAGTFAQAEATTTALAGKQPLDGDLTAIAGLDSTTAGTVASDGAGWVKKTYAQLKTALGLATIATSGKLADATDVTTSGAAVDELLTVSAVSPFGVTTKSLDELIDTTPVGLADLHDVDTTSAVVGQHLALVQAGTNGYRWPTPAQQPALAKLFAGLAARHQQPCRIVAVGSSTTEGAAATIPANRYINRLAAMLQAAYPSGIYVEPPVLTSLAAPLSTLPGVHVYNRGLSGQTSSAYVSSSLRDAIGTANPRAVIHMIGSNDYANGVAPATYKANVAAEVAAQKALIPGPCVHILIHSYRRIDVTTPAYPSTAYGDALREIAAADPDNVAFLDISQPYELAGIAGTDPLGLINTDGIHQDDPGHALMADLIRQGLDIPDGRPERYLVLDTFTRPASTTSLGEATSGQTWTALTGTWGINGAKAYLTAGGTAVVEAGAADVDMSAVITLDPTATAGLVFRCSDDANRLGVFLDGPAGAVTLFRADAGTSVGIASVAKALPAGDYVLRIVASGASIVAYLNGAAVLTYTLSGADQTKFGVFTKVGMRSAATAAHRWDNLTVKAA